MLNKKHFQKIREQLLSYAQKRREVIKAASDAQNLSKRAIFALQRDDRTAADQSLKTAGDTIAELAKKYKEDLKLFDEGAYRAALEEYTEAMLFKQFLDGKEIGEMKDLKINPDNYISGLCDVPGEILRYAIKSATERNFDMVKKCYDVAEAIVSELVDMDLTGYNRQKFDQAKQALNKLQQIQ